MQHLPYLCNVSKDSTEIQFKYLNYLNRIFDKVGNPKWLQGCHHPYMYVNIEGHKKLPTFFFL